jgi:hypothetical protein
VVQRVVGVLHLLLLQVVVLVAVLRLPLPLGVAGLVLPVLLLLLLPLLVIFCGYVASEQSFLDTPTSLFLTTEIGDVVDLVQKVSGGW